MHDHNKEKQQSSFRTSFATGSKTFKMQIIRANTFSKNEYLFLLYNFVTQLRVPDLFMALQIFQNRGKFNFQYNKSPFNKISFIAAKISSTHFLQYRNIFTVSISKIHGNFFFEIYVEGFSFLTSPISSKCKNRSLTLKFQPFWGVKSQKYAYLVSVCSCVFRIVCHFAHM